MDWIELTEESTLEKIKQDSAAKTVVIYKHSTRCSISGAALDRLERKWSAEDFKQVDAYYLDLLAYRSISNKIATMFYVEHQSPQVLVIRQGRCVYHQSHFDIQYQELKEVLNS
ncbi:MAG: bacillithiol system redox-active protein YtxJ [Cytophagaceae bacterium]|jgi:bacillithiol system protein YtxJ|nr:bacillithiol system redox-active protein YtxJ [Cytophagaceae bacterium]